MAEKENKDRFAIKIFAGLISKVYQGRGSNFPLLKKNEAVEPNSRVHLYSEDHHLIVGALDFDKDIS